MAENSKKSSSSQNPRWISHYNDGTCLHQYDGDTEYLFEDIEEEKLSHFDLIYNDKLYRVDLNTGVITVDGLPISFYGYKEDKEFRLIYYVKNRRHLSVGKKGIIPHKKHERFPCIGWRTKEEGTVIKRIIKISPDGSIEFLQ